MVFILGGLLVLTVVMVAFALTGHRAARRATGDLDRTRRFDVLTGLPNRDRLDVALAAMLARPADDRRGAVTLVELSRFEMVNDTYGHEVGDGLLIAVADQLGRALGAHERLFRLVGSQFVVLDDQAGSTLEVERRTHELAEVSQQPFRVGTDLLQVATATGAALVERRHVEPLDVLHDATIALQQAEQRQGERIAVFDLSMRPARTTADSERRLREALENDEFWVLYLPVVTLGDHEIVGVEALLRWADPERGLVGPERFIRHLDDSGLIGPVGDWVIETACAQNRTWQRSHPTRELVTTVNVSPRQLASAGFLERVLDIIERTGIEPARLCLEITEGAVMREVEASWGVLRDAKEAGIKLALDDFGSGYSSLNYLRRFSLDVLKIDRSFVSGICDTREDAAIAQQLVAMAHALDVAPVAEGVDSAEQARMLHGMGCDFAQGYYFSPPQPVSAIEPMLATGRVRPAGEATGIDWSGGTATTGPRS